MPGGEGGSSATLHRAGNRIRALVRPLLGPTLSGFEFRDRPLCESGDPELVPVHGAG
jgi:hypothetical protein